MTIDNAHPSMASRVVDAQPQRGKKSLKTDNCILGTYTRPVLIKNVLYQFDVCIIYGLCKTALSKFAGICFFSKLVIFWLVGLLLVGNKSCGGLVDPENSPKIGYEGTGQSGEVIFTETQVFVGYPLHNILLQN